MACAFAEPCPIRHTPFTPSSWAPPYSSGDTEAFRSISPSRTSSAPSLCFTVSVITSLNAENSALPTPSKAFSATFPVKPSVTITSKRPSATSRPSALPAKPATCSLSSLWQVCANSEPFSSSAPMFSNPIRGEDTPRAVCAYAAPIKANCTRYSGLQSAFAPTSHMTHLPAGEGMTVAMAGRFTCGRRPMNRVAAAMHAPVEPAEKKPWASPSFTSLQPTTIDESRFLRTARAPCSPISTICKQGRAMTRGREAAKGSTTSGRPHKTTSKPSRAARASSTPANTTSGASSPPNASTAILRFGIFSSPFSCKKAGLSQGKSRLSFPAAKTAGTFAPSRSRRPPCPCSSRTRGTRGAGV